MAAARSVWKGFLRFSLVTVPVKAYTATNSGGGGGGIRFNQLHKACNSRIQYKKTCPVHGEIPANEIVKGYEFADNQYVLVDDEEIEAARVKSERTIGLESFVPPGAVDPAYFDGKTYYLLPDGPVAAKPYALLRKVMLDTGRHAFATRVSHGHDETVLIRPARDVLAMQVLSQHAAVRPPTEFADEAPRVDVTPEEQKLARTLIDAMAVDTIDLSKYTDRYADQVRQVVEAKVSGKQVVEVAEADEPAPATGNLMDALQKSLEDATRKAAAQKPPKLAAPGTAAKAATTRQRKKA